MFTKGQVERMRSCLYNNTWRQQLCLYRILNKRACWIPQLPLLVCGLPVASFGYGNYLGLYYSGKAVSFYDASSWTPDSWKWSFQGGVPAVPTMVNPSVVFPAAGTFKVKLLVSNAFGADSIEQMVVVREELFYPDSHPVESFDDINLHAQIKKHTLPNANAWQTVLVDPLNGNYAIYLDSCNNGLPVSKQLPLLGRDLPALHRKLEFKVAHATALGVPMVSCPVAHCGQKYF